MYRQLTLSRMLNTKTSTGRCFYSIASMVLLSFIVMFGIFNHRSMFHPKWYESPSPCDTPKKVVDQMVDLTFIVSDVFKSLKVNHVLCYGALWGALRIGKFLPWDNNADICVMRHELEKVPWSDFVEAMSSRNVHMTYNYLHGELTIRKKDAVCIVTIFYKSPPDNALRDGWENRFLFFFRGSPIVIPAKILEAPFSTVLFHGREIPVPHDDVELQKYLYKDDWWMEKPPPGCPGVR